MTAEQQARAEALVAAHAAPTCRSSPTSPRSAPLGFRSIGDAATGYEHYINIGYIGDDAFLDPTKPESLVYRVDGDAPHARVGDVHRQGHADRRPRRSSTTAAR